MKNNKKPELMDPMLLSRENVQILMDADLSLSQLGEFIKLLLGYQVDGVLPKRIDPVVYALWKVIRADMKREFGEGVR